MKGLNVRKNNTYIQILKANYCMIYLSFHLIISQDKDIKKINH